MQDRQNTKHIRQLAKKVKQKAERVFVNIPLVKVDTVAKKILEMTNQHVKINNDDTQRTSWTINPTNLATANPKMSEKEDNLRTSIGEAIIKEEPTPIIPPISNESIKEELIQTPIIDKTEKKESNTIQPQSIKQNEWPCVSDVIAKIEKNLANNQNLTTTINSSNKKSKCAINSFTLFNHDNDKKDSEIKNENNISIYPYRHY